MDDRFRQAGLASAEARRKRLGEPGFRAAMQVLGQKGGRPTAGQALEKALKLEAPAGR